MAMSNWPLVAVNDDGIRPVGGPDMCFYCLAKVGQPHGPECVIVTKRVKVRYIFEIEIDVPHSWDQGNVEFHKNESSWCANNATDEILEFQKEEGMDDGLNCLCNNFTAEFIGVADPTPRRKLREAKE